MEFAAQRPVVVMDLAAGRTKIPVLTQIMGPHVTGFDAVEDIDFVGVDIQLVRGAEGHETCARRPANG